MHRTSCTDTRCQKKNGLGTEVLQCYPYFAYYVGINFSTIKNITGAEPFRSCRCISELGSAAC